jgi:ABC-type bacteriocin/lantibiotic exporter with double-glycine peptidase domain
MHWLLLACVVAASLSFVHLPPPAYGHPRLAALHVVQQSTDYTCGPAVAVGVARALGLEADEMTVAREMGTSPKVGTTPEQMAGWFQGKGFKVAWGEHGTMEMLRANVKAGLPTLVEWIDWGGHWVVAVGIDDKGTERTDDDDIIFADPWDRIDGKEDGLTRFNLERFDSMWFDAFLFGRPMKRLWITVEPGSRPPPLTAQSR